MYDVFIFYKLIKNVFKFSQFWLCMYILKKLIILFWSVLSFLIFRFSKLNCPNTWALTNSSSLDFSLLNEVYSSSFLYFVLPPVQTSLKFLRSCKCPCWVTISVQLRKWTINLFINLEIHQRASWNINVHCSKACRLKLRAQQRNSCVLARAQRSPLRNNTCPPESFHILLRCTGLEPKCSTFFSKLWTYC